MHTHGFLTVDGTKMSKSRGTFILAKTYLDHLSPEYLRYYYAAKLNGSADDLDLNLEDFVARVNSDLVGKVINIASRTAGFLVKQFDGALADTVHDEALMAQFHAQVEPIAALFESGDTAKAMREVTALADAANQYIAKHEPHGEGGLIGRGVSAGVGLIGRGVSPWGVRWARTRARR